MESHSEDKKCVKIRHFVRRAILPLVQEIYTEDPADVISFSYDYFDGLLRSREMVEKNTEDPNFEHTGEIRGKGEDDRVTKSPNKMSQMVNASSNVQGSSSEPLLPSEKHCEGLSLRETSSWNISTESSAFLSFNIADATSRIGDQLCPTAEKPESLQSEIKSGDTSVSQKEEEKALKSDTLIESEASGQKKYEPTTKEFQNTYVLPSAPPEENYNENLEEFSREKKLQKFKIPKDLNCKNTNQNIQEMEINEISQNLEKDASSCSSADEKFPSVEENKVSNKPLSPNSSFGFVPHLYTYDEELREDEDKENSDDDLYCTVKAKGEMEELTKRLSETLQSLAQEFSSAETNFNEQVQSANEISDVLQGRHDAEETNENLKLTDDSCKNNETSNLGRDPNENSNSDGENLQARDEKNNLVTSTNYDIECKPKKSPEYFLSNSSVLQNNDSSKCAGIQKDKTVKDSLDFKDCGARNSKHQHQKNGQQSESTLSQDDRKDDDSKSDDHPSEHNINESLRRRWYQAHPLLDRNLHQLRPRFFRAHQVHNANDRNGTVHNIGEAGDVPCDRFYTVEEVSSGENFNSSLQSSRIAFAPPPTIGENNPHCSLSADEIRRRNVGRVSRNLSDRDLTNAPHTSQNVPYSWRHMAKPQAQSSEREERHIEQSLVKEKKDTSDSENDAKEHSKTNEQAIESEILSEVIVVKEMDAKTKVESSLDSQETSSPEDKKEETDIYQKSSYVENINRLSMLVKTNNENFASTPFQHQIDSNQDLDERNEKPLNIQQECNKDDSCAKKDVEVVQSISSDVSESARRESFEKLEPGLSSAAGDCTSFVMNGNNGEGINMQPSGRVIEENNTREQNQASTGASSAEYFQEMMGRVVEEQEVYKDSFESLNFSSYSESDKSSDNSETDEYGSNNNE